MADPTPTLHIHNTHGGYKTRVVTLTNVTLEICQTCHFIEAHCNHIKSTWNVEGTILTCDFCGIDGT